MWQPYKLVKSTVTWDFFLLKKLSAHSYTVMLSTYQGMNTLRKSNKKELEKLSASIVSYVTASLMIQMPKTCIWKEGDTDCNTR